MVRNNLKDTVYEYLYECIVSCKILPGEVIVEQEISDLLGISRTPVREALEKLESEGLVYHIPGKGTFVQTITAHDLEDIFELRAIFEEMALCSGINEITEQEIYEVEEILASLNETSSKEDYYLSDRMLHNIIIKHAYNKRMIGFLKRINSQLERLRRISAMTPKRLQKSKQEHFEILYALKDRDLNRAKQALKTHLENVKESNLEVAKRLN